MTINIIAYIVGAFCACLYVGFFAIKVGAPPLIIIVACCLALMVYSFVDDLRQEYKRARMHNGQR
jgi:hypothetical protein